MATARDVIESSLRLIGVLATGEAAGANDSSEALAVFNELLESLSNDRLMVFEVSRDTYTLTANTNPHTLGPSTESPDLAGDRPIRIETASLIESGKNVEHPIDIVDYRRWAAVRDKSTTSTIPYFMWCEKEPSTVKIWLYPICSATNTLVLYTWKALVSSLALATTLAYPPGYRRMLRYTLAVDLAAEFGTPLDPEIRRISWESKQSLKGSNKEAPIMGFDRALSGGKGYWDYRTGERYQ